MNQRLIHCPKCRELLPQTSEADKHVCRSSNEQLEAAWSDFCRDTPVALRGPWEAFKYAWKTPRPAVETTENLGMDTSWPLSDVLAKLIEATDHLLKVHSCDTHGHEEFLTAVLRGREYLATMRPVEPKAHHPDCHAMRCPPGDCNCGAVKATCVHGHNADVCVECHE